MGFISEYFADRREEEKTAACKAMWEADAPKHYASARSYLEEVLEREKRLAEKRRRQEEEQRKAEEARRKAEEALREAAARKGGSPVRESDTQVHFSLSAESAYQYIDSYDEGFILKFYAENDPLHAARSLSSGSVSGRAGLDMPFIIKVHKLMEEKGFTPAELYRRAQIDKTTFSKLANNVGTMPKRDTAIALALGLALDREQTNDLLKRAGYTLSHSSERDIVLEYCIVNRIFNVVTVNCILEELGLKPLGSSVS